MSRWLLASMIVGTGLACGVLGWMPARAVGQQSEANTSQDRGGGEENPAQRLDKAIESYEGRADQELEQSRKEISRLRKELTDLIELQFDMAITLAELQAEMRAQAASAPNEDNEGPGAGQSRTSNEQDQKRLRSVELSRELRQVQDNLRGLVSQKRNEADQLVSQLRNLRAQQRQAAAERERLKQEAKEREQNKGEAKD